MKITIPHSLGAAEARRRVETHLQAYRAQFARHIDDVVERWENNTLYLDVKARGYRGNGSIEVGDSEVTLEGGLPLFAKAFESRIRAAVVREAERIFRA
jgi:hypothetical protein